MTLFPMRTLSSFIAVAVLGLSLDGPPTCGQPGLFAQGTRIYGSPVDNAAVEPSDAMPKASAIVGNIVSWYGSWISNYGQFSVPDTSSGYIAIAAGEFHCLGLRTDGSVRAWGLNRSGQCTVPPPNAGFIAIAAGQDHSLGLKADGTIVAWGRKDFHLNDVPEPNRDFVAIAAGSAFNLGLKSSGQIVAWGANSSGECTIPTPNSDFVAITAGCSHALGLKASGSVVGWGYNTGGQCIVPQPNTGFTSISAGDYHSLGLKRDGSIVAWGGNGNGECNVPVPNADFIAAVAGGDFSVGLRADGSIVEFCWDPQGRYRGPQPNRGFMQIAPGKDRILALQSDGIVLGVDEISGNRVVIEDDNCSPGRDHLLVIPYDRQKYPLISANPYVFFKFVVYWPTEKLARITVEQLSEMLKGNCLQCDCDTKIPFASIRGCKVNDELRSLDKFQLVDRRDEVVANLVDCYAAYRSEYDRYMQDTFIVANGYDIDADSDAGRTAILSGFGRDISVKKQTGYIVNRDALNADDYDVDRQMMQLAAGDIPVPMAVAKEIFGAGSNAWYSVREYCRPTKWYTRQFDEGMAYNTGKREFVFGKDDQAFYTVDRVAQPDGGLIFKPK